MRSETSRGRRERTVRRKTLFGQEFDQVCHYFLLYIELQVLLWVKGYGLPYLSGVEGHERRPRKKQIMKTQNQVVTIQRQIKHLCESVRWKRGFVQAVIPLPSGPSFDAVPEQQRGELLPMAQLDVQLYAE